MYYILSQSKSNQLQYHPPFLPIHLLLPPSCATVLCIRVGNHFSRFSPPNKNIHCFMQLEFSAEFLPYRYGKKVRLHSLSKLARRSTY